MNPTKRGTGNPERVLIFRFPGTRFRTISAPVMHLYFMGICGTAMGNAALLFRATGHTVSGSDTGVYPPMSDMLRDAGVTILEGWDADRLAALKPDVVVVGNVVSAATPRSSG